MFILPWKTLKQWAELLGLDVVKDGPRYSLKAGMLPLVKPCCRPPFRRRATKIIMKKIEQRGGRL